MEAADWNRLLSPVEQATLPTSVPSPPMPARRCAILHRGASLGATWQGWQCWAWDMGVATNSGSTNPSGAVGYDPTTHYEQGSPKPLLMVEPPGADVAILAIEIEMHDPDGEAQHFADPISGKRARSAWIGLPAKLPEQTQEPTGGSFVATVTGGNRVSLFVFTGDCGGGSGTATNLWQFDDVVSGGATVVVRQAVNNKILVTKGCAPGEYWTYVVCGVSVTCPPEL